MRYEQENTSSRGDPVDNLRTLELIREWATKTAGRVGAQIVEREVTRGSADGRTSADIPPCPLCGAEVQRFDVRWEPLGATFDPCGCSLAEASGK